MTLLLTLLIMAVVAVVAAVAAGRIAGGLDAPASSLPGRGLPGGPVDVAALDRVRFSPALRGYRMDEVDDVLDRLSDELRRRDEELAWLRDRNEGRERSEGRDAVPGRGAFLGGGPVPGRGEESLPEAGATGQTEHDVEA